MKLILWLRHKIGVRTIGTGSNLEKRVLFGQRMDVPQLLKQRQLISWYLYSLWRVVISLCGGDGFRQVFLARCMLGYYFHGDWLQVSRRNLKPRRVINNLTIRNSTLSWTIMIIWVMINNKYVELYNSIYESSFGLNNAANNMALVFLNADNEGLKWKESPQSATLLSLYWSSGKIL